jgi:broad specificity polyphosphatase/5'/3'-nucleotidase SurE
MFEELARVRGLIPTLGSSALIFARHFPVKMLLMLMETTAPTTHQTVTHIVNHEQTTTHFTKLNIMHNSQKSTHIRLITFKAAETTSR